MCGPLQIYIGIITGFVFNNNRNNNSTHEMTEMEAI